MDVLFQLATRELYVYLSIIFFFILNVFKCNELEAAYIMRIFHISESILETDP